MCIQFFHARESRYTILLTPKHYLEIPYADVSPFRKSGTENIEQLTGMSYQVKITIIKLLFACGTHSHTSLELLSSNKEFYPSLVLKTLYSCRLEKSL